MRSVNAMQIGLDDGSERAAQADDADLTELGDPDLRITAWMGEDRRSAATVADPASEAPGRALAVSLRSIFRQRGGSKARSTITCTCRRKARDPSADRASPLYLLENIPVNYKLGAVGARSLTSPRRPPSVEL